MLTGVARDGQVGATVARAFAGAGATLALLARDADAVEHQAATLTESGGVATAYPCDLTDAAAVDDVARRVALSARASATRPAGRIDALVNLAGGFAMSGPLGESDLAVVSQQIATNLTTAYIASRVFVPMIRDGGSVVYFASANVLPGAPSARMSAYVASKAAVVGLMRSVADEGRARGLRSNAVAPISIRTGDNVRAMGAGARYVEPEAVADAVLFLCSPEARSITGQIFRLAD